MLVLSSVNPSIYMYNANRIECKEVSAARYTLQQGYVAVRFHEFLLPGFLGFQPWTYTLRLQPASSSGALHNY